MSNHTGSPSAPNGTGDGNVTGDGNATGGVDGALGDAAQWDPLLVFGAIAALIFLGFLGNLIFTKLRFNDTLLLILAGVLLGPIYGIIPQQSVQDISIYVGPLALILILFDGGLAFRIRDLLHGLGGAAVMGAISFTLSTFLATLVAWWLLPVSFTVALILGAILGGTSALVVMPSLQHLKTTRRTDTILSLESALTDVLVVVVSFTLISIVALGHGPDAQGLASRLVITFAMSIMLGAVAGLLWLYLVPKVRDKPFGYMLTLGFMFSLYVLVEWLLEDTSRGGGPLAVLAFGIILGNAHGLGQAIRDRVGDNFGEGMKKFQGEIAFLVRTFFFIYLGVLVDLDLLKDPVTWGVSILIFLVLAGARYVAVSATNRTFELGPEGWIMLVMMPRGLAAAVLAAEPANQGIQGTGSFVAIAFLVLILTNLSATVGAIVVERSQARGPGSGAEGNGRKGGKSGGPGKKKTGRKGAASKKGRSGKGGASKKGTKKLSTKKGGTGGYTRKDAPGRTARSQPRRTGKRPVTDK